MLTFVTIVHVVLCVFMIFVILLQPGKDAGMGAALGGGAATSAFGGRGAVTFLSKLTAAFAGLFFLTSLGLSFVGLKSSVVAGGSVMTSTAKPIPGSPAPSTTGAAATSTPVAPGSSSPSESGTSPASPAAPAR